MADSDAWTTPRQQPSRGGGLVYPRVRPPVGKPVCWTNQLDFLQKHVLTAVLAHNHSWPFKTPVDAIKLCIPNYHSVIERPMDFGTIEKRLKNVYYRNAAECMKDFEQVFANCYAFNNREDDVSIMCQNVESEYRRCIEDMPAQESVLAVKSKTRQCPTAAKRKSTSSSESINPSKGKKTVRKPVEERKKAGQAQAPSAAPRKWSEEDKIFFQKLLDDLLSAKCEEFNRPFLLPVDVESLGLHDYYTVVKTPMDLSTVKKRFDYNEYSTVDDLISDLCLIYSNCLAYNEAGPVRKAGEKLRDFLEAALKRLNSESAKADVLVQEVLSSVHRAEQIMHFVAGELASHAVVLERFPQSAEASTVVPQKVLSSVEALLNKCAVFNELYERIKARGSAAQTGNNKNGRKRPCNQTNNKAAQKPASKRNSVGFLFDPSTPEAERPMTHQEKLALSRAINKLHGDYVADVVRIVKARENLPGATNHEVEVDFDSLKTITLRELEAYIQYRQADCVSVEEPAGVLEKRKQNLEDKLRRLGGLAGQTKNPRARAPQRAEKEAVADVSDHHSDQGHQMELSDSDSSSPSSSSSSSSDDDSDVETADDTADPNPEPEVSKEVLNNQNQEKPAEKEAAVVEKMEVEHPEPVIETKATPVEEPKSAEQQVVDTEPREKTVSVSEKKTTPVKKSPGVAKPNAQICNSVVSILDRLLPQVDENANKDRDEAEAVELRRAEDRAKRETLGQAVDLNSQKELMDNFEFSF